MIFSNPKLGDGLFDVCELLKANTTICELDIESSSVEPPKLAWNALAEILQKRGKRRREKEENNGTDISLLKISIV